MSRIAVTGMTTSVQAAAEANSRKARELNLIAFGGETIAEPAHGLDDIDGKFLAQPPDEHFDGVRVAIEILLVEMLDELGAGDDAVPVQHEIGEHAVFVAGQLDRLAVDGDARRLGVETERAAF